MWTWGKVRMEKSLEVTEVLLSVLWQGNIGKPCL